MPSDAFFGKGSDTVPVLFLTDELASQYEALRKAWPNERQVLCLFHYLQHWWKWLWEAKQEINIDDRKIIYGICPQTCTCRDPTRIKKDFVS